MSIAMLRKFLKRWFRTHGYEVHKLSLGELDDITRLVRITEARKIKTFLDVGANQGQFSIDLRFAGFSEKIISFEPLSEAYSILTRISSHDPKWIIAPRCAVGNEETESSINVAGNSFSSSLLPMKEIHAQCAPSSSYVGEETVMISKLSVLLSSLNVPLNDRFALKIDTQGFEAEVLKGAIDLLPRVEVIFTELSLFPLYEGAPSFIELYNLIIGYGFRCIALSQEFSDPQSGEMLQVNGTFIRC
jgi:FkbM family methyltransferase